MEFYPLRRIQPWLVRFTDRVSFQYLRNINRSERSFNLNSVGPAKCRKQVLSFGQQNPRPWVPSFLVENCRKVHKESRVAQALHPRSLDFFRGDKVQILDGEDRGKQGTIVEIYEETNECIVYGRNLSTRMQSSGPTEMLHNAGQSIVRLAVFENVVSMVKDIALVDPFDGKPCEVEWKKQNKSTTGIENGRETVEDAPLSLGYIDKTEYRESEFDTPVNYSTKVTYDEAEGDVISCLLQK
ncbi:MAG: 39S ribosomal protein L24, mitochondrial [Marteilia pararefringens]